MSKCHVSKSHFPDVSSKRHVRCTFKSVCARSPKETMSRGIFGLAKARRVFLGFGVPGGVSVPVFIVDFG